MKQISDKAVGYVEDMYCTFISITLFDDKWLLEDFSDSHDSIKVIAKINNLVEIGREFEISFWEVVRDRLGKDRYREVLALHKKCRIAENKRGR